MNWDWIIPTVAGLLDCIYFYYAGKREASKIKTVGRF